ncbi:tocopherol cyclase family protein [Treponema sp. HNW]|uniref:tocopherol cyclase family protein n=1 Tax=Treponema sp. HNW TaxID=3116654 RepID=UPI003D11BE3B
MRDIAFRGSKNHNNYFEGWYFKCVDEQNDLIVILIPGISIFKEKTAFLQYIIYYKTHTASGFLKYDIDDFKITEPFGIKLPHGFISKEHIQLAFEDMECNLKLTDFTPLKNTVLAPSIMGFFEYLKMPCYHDIVSLNHSVTGTVLLKNERIEFNGKGYIEGDRGSSFPQFYIWAQCNNFTSQNSSLFMSVADISTPFFKFLGHIAVYYRDGKEYRFASYAGSRAKVDVSADKTSARIEFTNGSYCLKIALEADKGNPLIAPMNRAMDFKIKEQVKAKVKIDFEKTGVEKADAVLHTDRSEFCACEIVNWNTGCNT